VNHPYVPRRRDNENKAARETDDLLLLFTCVDENKLIDQLPRYVSDNPDAMPSIRLYEGELQGIVKMINKLHDKVSEYGSMIAILSREVKQVQSSVLSTQVGGQPHTRHAQRDTRHQQDETTRPTALSQSEFPSLENTTTTAQSADRSSSRQGGPAWASIASTPLDHHNRFSVLASTETDEHDDRGNDQLFSTRTKRRASRRTRNQSSQQPAAQSGAMQRRAPALLGKSMTVGKLTAAHLIRKKAVFCVDNLNVSCTVEDITNYVSKELAINVLSCFQVRPRRRRNDADVVDRKAFRLCICEDDRNRLLRAEAWPNSIIISDWYFKPQREEVTKRLRVNADEPTATGSASTTMTREDTVVKLPGAAVAASPVAQLDDFSDETVVEVYMDSVSHNGE